MRDYVSNDVATAAYLAGLGVGDFDPGPDYPPTRAELEAEEHLGRYTIEGDAYRGICGGCKQPVSAFAKHPGGHEGSCLWTDGPWHPSCRERDKQRLADEAAEAEARRPLWQD